jgi:uncharacterized repeat protein (TIGR01451 family)
MTRRRILTAAGIFQMTMAILLSLTYLLGQPGTVSQAKPALGFTSTPTTPPTSTPISTTPAPPSTPVPTQPQLQLTKVADRDYVDAGQVFTYTVEITNIGPVAATGVTLVDEVPAQLEVLEATVSQGTVSVDENLVMATVGVLGPGYSAILVIRVRVGYSVGPGISIENIVVGDSDQTGEIISNAVVTVYGLLPESGSGGRGAGMLLLCVLLTGAGLFMAALGVRRRARLV